MTQCLHLIRPLRVLGVIGSFFFFRVSCPAERGPMPERVVWYYGKSNGICGKLMKCQ